MVKYPQSKDTHQQIITAVETPVCSQQLIPVAETQIIIQEKRGAEYNIVVQSWYNCKKEKKKHQKQMTNALVINNAQGDDRSLFPYTEV